MARCIVVVAFVDEADVFHFLLLFLLQRMHVFALRKEMHRPGVQYWYNYYAIVQNCFTFVNVYFEIRYRTTTNVDV